MRREPRPFVPRARYTKIPLTDEERKLRDLRDKVQPKAERAFETRYTMLEDHRILTSYGRGPYSRTDSVPYPPPYGAARQYYRVSTWYRSRTKARIAPNPYRMTLAQTQPLTGGSWAVDDAGSCWAYGVVVNGVPNDVLAFNSARSKFVGKVRDSQSAALAVTAAEWEQSNKMIAYRAGQLLQAVKAIKNRDVRSLNRALQLDIDVRSGGKRGQPRRGVLLNDQQQRQKRELESRVKRANASDVSSVWLEYHFGWAPLVQDIDSAVKVLASNPPPLKVRASGRYTEVIDYGNRNPYQHLYQGLYRCRVLIGADCYVSNPNLALATQLGLVNPASVAWELIPFSFVVDWFTNVGSFLDSWTDLLGYKLNYPFTTTTRTVEDLLHTYTQPSVVSTAKQNACSVTRDLGIPPVRLAVPPFKGFSPARGATAIALLLQQFLSLKK